MPTWLTAVAKVLLSWAGAGVVGAIAVTSLVALVQPGTVRDVGIVVLWIAAIGAGTVLSVAWVTADRPTSGPPSRKDGAPPMAIWNDSSEQYARGVKLAEALHGMSGPPEELARLARTALDTWEQKTREALRKDGLPTDDFDAPISAIDGMHYLDRPLETLKIKLRRLHVLLL